MTVLTRWLGALSLFIVLTLLARQFLTLLTSSSSLASRASFHTSHSYFNRSVVVSYVMFAPQNTSGSQCRKNADLFVKRAITYDPQVTFIFSLVGDIRAPYELEAMMQVTRNVQIRRVPNDLIDLYAHGKVVAAHLSSCDAFVFLNCGARGPYQRSAGHASLDWLHTFIARLSNEVRAVGATISCEVSPHIQSYAMAVDAHVASIIKTLWVRSSKSIGTYAEELLRMEVDTSNAILALDNSIACLDSRYSKRDFRPSSSRDQHCDTRYTSTLGNSSRMNPVLCVNEDDPGCFGVEPCEVMFVKYDDDMLRQRSFSAETLRRFALEDHHAKKGKAVCAAKEYFPIAPYWNVEAIVDQSLLLTENTASFGFDSTSSIVLIVRAHGDYLSQLTSLVTLIASLRDDTIRVLILPTEKGSFQTIHTYILQVFALFAPNSRLNLSVLRIHDNIYDTYGRYLRTLCTQEWRQRVILSGVPTEFVDNRFCGVNSPLHYLLVDIAINYILRYCINCMQIIVTNADNSYSPSFFGFVKLSTEFSIVMSNMVSKGRAYNTSPDIGNIDLGAYAVSVDFLRRSKVTFLNALPMRPEPQDYHNADGHFLMRLAAKGATVVKTQAYLFFHN